MKIWLFYAKFKVCFPHVWEFLKQETDKKGRTYNIYKCAICGKIKRKRIKDYEPERTERQD